MNGFFILLIAILLILFSYRELFSIFKANKRFNKFSPLINGEKAIKKAQINQANQANIAFEKIITKNSAILNLIYRFQSETIWKVCAILIVFSVFYIVNSIINVLEIDQSSLVIIIFMIMVLVIFLPPRIVKRQANRRIVRISRDLPIVIDMMAIMIKSGMTIENAFKYLSSKIKPINSDVATILERACMMMDVNGIESAIDLINREVPSKEMRMLCATLKRSIGFGNSIYDVLLELSAEMREMQKLSIEEKIAAISAKMTMPMMGFILVPVLVLVIAPIIMHLGSLPFFNK